MENLDPNLTIAMLGEQQLLQSLQRFSPPDVVGDDGAILMPQPGHVLVVTTDMLVDGIHFCNRTTSPGDVGWRSAAANLSDLAAMGATPLGLTISLGLPASLPFVWLDQFYQGVADCLQTYGTAIVGGDVSRSPVLTVSMTALGEVLPHEQILRSTAQPGDAIVVTGPHGASRAGLEILLQPEWGQKFSPAERLALKQVHQRPRPRLDVLPILRQLTLHRAAGMDSSDGLADAILQICRASGVGAEIQESCLPLPASLQKVLPPHQAIEWTLYGGEDFELVLCLSPSAAQTLVEELNSTAMVVGHIMAGNEVSLRRLDGVKHPLSLQQGYQHFG